mmetsp:Transcript_56224/g.137882  ORF Transcript_56224/g.137882 Transcript_56224/m.137882 type:complete len:534 (+) Transcript_56224:773-2374(+)
MTTWRSASPHDSSAHANALRARQQSAQPPDESRPACSLGGQALAQELSHVLKLLGAEAVVHPPVRPKLRLDPELERALVARLAPAVQDDGVRVAVAHEDGLRLANVRRLDEGRQPRAEGHDAREGLVHHHHPGRHRHSASLGEAGDDNAVVRDALFELSTHEVGEVRRAAEHPVGILLVRWLEPHDIEPRRHLHPHVERDGLGRCCWEEELDVGQRERLRHGRPAEARVPEPVQPDHRRRVLVPLGRGEPLNNLAELSLWGALEDLVHELRARRALVAARARVHALHQRVVVRAVVDHAHGVTEVLRERVLAHEAPRPLVAVHLDRALDGVSEESQLHLPAPRAPLFHVRAVRRGGHARLPLDPLPEGGTVELVILPPHHLLRCTQPKLARVRARRDGDGVEQARPVPRHPLAHVLRAREDGGPLLLARLDGAGKLDGRERREDDGEGPQPQRGCSLPRPQEAGDPRALAGDARPQGGRQADCPWAREGQAHRVRSDGPRGQAHRGQQPSRTDARHLSTHKRGSPGTGAVATR